MRRQVIEVSRTFAADRMELQTQINELQQNVARQNERKDRSTEPMEEEMRLTADRP
eukprot:SAG22_NODE_17750_length_299_cov_0.770000_1_plen_55_part_10